MDNKRIVNTGNYQGPERRSGRLKLSFSDYRYLFAGFCTLLIAGTTAWLNLNWFAKTTNKTAEENKVKVEEVEKKNTEHDKDIGEINIKLKNIDENVDEVQDEVKEIAKEQKTMRADMNKGFFDLLKAIKK